MNTSGRPILRSVEVSSTQEEASATQQSSPSSWLGLQSPVGRSVCVLLASRCTAEWATIPGIGFDKLASMEAV